MSSIIGIERSGNEWVSVTLAPPPRGVTIRNVNTLARLLVKDTDSDASVEITFKSCTVPEWSMNNESAINFYVWGADNVNRNESFKMLVSARHEHLFVAAVEFLDEVLIPKWREEGEIYQLSRIPFTKSVHFPRQCCVCYAPVTTDGHILCDTCHTPQLDKLIRTIAKATNRAKCRIEKLEDGWSIRPPKNIASSWGAMFSSLAGVNPNANYIFKVISPIVSKHLKSTVAGLTYTRRFLPSTCAYCGKPEYGHKLPDYICTDCQDKVKQCAICESRQLDHNMTQIDDGRWVCNNHLLKNKVCHVCGTKKTKLLGLDPRLTHSYHRRGTLNICIDCTRQAWNTAGGFNTILAGELSYALKFENKMYAYNKHTKAVVSVSNNSVIPFMGVEIESAFEGSPKYKEYVNRTATTPALEYIIADVLKTVNGRLPILHPERPDYAAEYRYIYPKHDGSVPSLGTEWVTNPMTLDAHRHVDYSGIFKWKCPNNDCGGHIHLSRSSITPKMEKLIDDFVYDYQSFITTIGQRTLNGYCSYGGTDVPAIEKVKARVKRKVPYLSQKYSALNWTKNTLELRFFRSPASEAELYKNLEFVHALWALARNSKIITGNITPTEFMLFVSTNKNSYPYLFEFINANCNGGLFNKTPRSYSQDAKCHVCNSLFMPHEGNITTLNFIEGSRYAPRQVCSTCASTIRPSGWMCPHCLVTLYGERVPVCLRCGSTIHHHPTSPLDLNEPPVDASHTYDYDTEYESNDEDYDGEEYDECGCDEDCEF